MAADAYLKTAAGQLQQGADALKREAAEIRSLAATKKQQLERELTGKMAAMKGEQLRSQSLGTNPVAPVLEQDIRRLQNDIDDLKRQIDQTTNEAEQQARGKESAVQTLNGQASSLQQMAGDPRMR